MLLVHIRPGTWWWWQFIYSFCWTESLYFMAETRRHVKSDDFIERIHFNNLCKSVVHLDLGPVFCIVLYYAKHYTLVDYLASPKRTILSSVWCILKICAATRIRLNDGTLPTSFYSRATCVVISDSTHLVGHQCLCVAHHPLVDGWWSCKWMKATSNSRFWWLLSCDKKIIATSDYIIIWKAS